MVLFPLFSGRETEYGGIYQAQMVVAGPPMLPPGRMSQ